MNTKLHAITDTNGRSIRLFITAGQISVYPVQKHFWAAYPKQTGFWRIEDMTRIGSKKP